MDYLLSTTHSVCFMGSASQHRAAVSKPSTQED